MSDEVDITGPLSHQRGRRRDRRMGSPVW